MPPATPCNVSLPGGIFIRIFFYSPCPGPTRSRSGKPPPGRRERGQKGWKAIARIASIRNSKERTSSVRASHSSRESADVSPHNTRSADPRGEITCFPRWKAMIGVANGSKRRRKRWEPVNPSWVVRHRILQFLAISPNNRQIKVSPPPC